MTPCGHVHTPGIASSTLQFVEAKDLFPSLDRKDSQIRVLHLLPHSTAENIVCELHVESLLGNHTFEALSYCWGSADDPVSIDVNGYEFKVTQNLNAALKSLIPGPGSKGPRKLWIDAICINQGHHAEALAERRQQVMLMGDIYSAASSVTAYLGEPFEGLDEAIRYLETSASNPELHFDPQNPVHNQSGGDATSLLLSRSLVRFFNYPWWTRMWIVQEYCLAKALYFQIGNSRVAGDVCAEAIQHLLHHQDTGCCDRRSFPLHGQLNDNGRRRQDVWASLSKLQSLEDSSGQDNNSGLVNILDGLGRFGGREASDPRDKFFALRSLCNEADRKFIEVDYEQCARCVFVDVTLRWIMQQKDLNILSYLGMPKSRADKTVDMPSFAINWGKSPRQGDLASWHRRVAAQARLFKACKDTRSSWSIRPQVSVPPDSITANGFLFDTVKSVSDGFNGNFYDPDSFGHWVDSTRPLRENLVYQKPLEAMIRTTCSDMMYSGEFSRISDHHYVLLDLWWGELRRLYSTNRARPPGIPPMQTDYPNLSAFTTETIPSIREPISTSALGRDIVVTVKGYLGLAPKGCQSGDKVAVMAGGAVPIILRKVAVEEREDQSLSLEVAADASYEVIGDAYVHGIMDGQAFGLCRRDGQQLDQLNLV